MSKRSPTQSLFLVITLLVMTSLGAPSAVAADKVTIQVADAISGGIERSVDRMPKHHIPDGTPDTWSRGISLLATESGLTVLVESVAVTVSSPAANIAITKPL